MASSEPCHEPTNGSGRCLRSDDIQALFVGQQSLDRSQTEFSMTTNAALSALRSDVRRNGLKIDKLLDGLRFGHIQPAEPVETQSLPRPPAISIEWDPDEDTGVHPLPVWSARAREAHEKASSLQSELAAAKARLEERDRQSERVRLRQAATSDVTIKKWQIVAGIIVGGGATIAAIGQMIAALGN